MKQFFLSHAGPHHDSSLNCKSNRDVLWVEICNFYIYWCLGERQILLSDCKNSDTQHLSQMPISSEKLLSAYEMIML